MHRKHLQTGMWIRTNTQHVNYLDPRHTLKKDAKKKKKKKKNAFSGQQADRGCIHQKARHATINHQSA